jgi:hypothetical protein
VTLEEVAFEGHACVRVEAGGVAATVTTDVGPRVLGFGREGRNAFAALPDLGLDRPGGERFAFVGGHRLWVAPEEPDVTYRDAERPLAVTELDGGVHVEAPPDGAGFAKAISMRPDRDGWIVDHEVRNGSDAASTVAVWAITQLRPGGIATLPLAPSGDGVRADRSLVLWPYTDPTDPRIEISRDAVRLRSTGEGEPFKVGAAPGAGALAYAVDGEVFAKHVDVSLDEPYADLGAALQVFVHARFCELETLGPLRTLAPGEAVSHRERWTLRAEGGP